MKCEICGKDKKKQEIEINMLKSELCDLQQIIKYLEEVNRKLRRKTGQLEDNWNELRKYLFEIRKRGFALQNLANVTKNTEPNIAILIIINKMKEIKQGSDSK